MSSNGKWSVDEVMAVHRGRPLLLDAARGLRLGREILPRPIVPQIPDELRAIHGLPAIVRIAPQRGDPEPSARDERVDQPDASSAETTEANDAGSAAASVDRDEPPPVRPGSSRVQDDEVGTHWEVLAQIRATRGTDEVDAEDADASDIKAPAAGSTPPTTAPPPHNPHVIQNSAIVGVLVLMGFLIYTVAHDSGTTKAAAIAATQAHPTAPTASKQGMVIPLAPTALAASAPAAQPLTSQDVMPDHPARPETRAEEPHAGGLAHIDPAALGAAPARHAAEQPTQAESHTAAPANVFAAPIRAVLKNIHRASQAESAPTVAHKAPAAPTMVTEQPSSAKAPATESNGDKTLF